VTNFEKVVFQTFFFDLPPHIAQLFFRQAFSVQKTGTAQNLLLSQMASEGRDHLGVTNHF